MAIVSYPSEYRNYCLFDEQKVQGQIKKGDLGLEEIRQSLSNPKTEDEVVEDLFILNRMLDEGVDKQKISNIYPELSKYNSTFSDGFISGKQTNNLQEPYFQRKYILR